jgi:hypothetical protein
MFTNVIKIIKMICSRNEFLLVRIFENPEDYQANKKVFGVWLCDKYKWKCIIVNDLIPVNKNLEPCFLYHAGKSTEI